MPIAAFILSIVLMLPFLAGGVHTLRERYIRHTDISRQTELQWLAGVAAFLVVQLLLLRFWIGSVDIFYAFTALALAAASTALYGPTFVSAASKVAVSVIHPPNEHRVDEPQFNCAEALESQGDYDGALREYMVIARIFPKDSETAFRVAHVFTELGRYEEAAGSFERGLRLSEDPERAVLAANRVADIYRDRLDREEDAVRVLTEYLERFTDSSHAELVQRRLNRMSRSGTATDLPNLDPSATAQ